MLNVGLIGLGPEWEHRYRPALAKLAPRLAVRCVHASIVSRAEQAAAELGCEVAPGLMSLMERDDVQALIMLDVAWYGLVPAQFACQVGKPAFIASRLTHRFCGAEKLLRRAAQTGVTLMPDFAHRYTPATSRLRELIATRLGRPQGLVVDVAAECAPVAPGAARSDAERDMLAVALDWIISLVGGMPIAVRASKHESTADYFGLHVEFRRPSAGGAAPAALIRLAAKPPVSSPNGFDRSPALRASVECVHGKALLEGPQDMKWDLSGEQFIESLASDRPAIEVMLDHFCRRVVGGLIPIPTFDDLYRVFQLVDAALEPQSRMNTSYTSRGSA